MKYLQLLIEHSTYKKPVAGHNFKIVQIFRVVKGACTPAASKIHHLLHKLH